MTRFIVLGIQRTGTNFLRSNLDSHPDVCGFGELLLMTPGPWPLLDPRGQGYEPGYLEYLKQSMLRQILHALPATRRVLIRRFLDLRYGTPGYRAVGFSLKLSQVCDLPWIVDYVTAKRMHVIELVRENVLHTHVSRLVAEQTGEPHVIEKKAATPTRVPTERLLAQLGQIRADHDACSELLPGLPRFHISYETLCTEFARSCGELLEFLGVDPNLALTSPYRKVNPERLADFVTNYDEVRDTLAGTDFEKHLDVE